MRVNPYLVGSFLAPAGTGDSDPAHGLFNGCS